MATLKVLVNNLPEGTPDELKEEILKLFEPFGTVVNCEHYRNNYIMVELDSEENCVNAVKELNGKLFQEKELSVEQLRACEKNLPVIKLTVSNVAAGIESDEIKNLFTKYGLVSDCKIEYGNGYVKVEATGDIRTAIKEMNGFVIDGVIMKVEPDVHANKVAAAVKTPPVSTATTPAAATPATAKTTIIKKTVSGKKSNRGRGANRSRGRGRIGLIRQFYEDEDLSALSISNPDGYYDDYGNGNYYDEMECDGSFYPPDGMMGGHQNFMPRRPGFGPPDPSFFPRRGMRGGPPGRLLRAPGPRPDGPSGYPPRLPMGGPEPGRGRFHGLRGRGMPPGPMGRGAVRGSFNGRGMMRGRGVFRGGPNGRGFPQGPYFPQEEFYEDEMPGQYLTPGNEMSIKIPRYAPFESNRRFPQPPMNMNNGPHPYYDGGFDGYEEEPMEQEYYEEPYYEEEYYEEEVIAPPPYLGSGGGYRESTPNFKNMRSSFSRPPNHRSNPQQQQYRQNVNQERPKKRTVAPGEPYPPPPLKPAGSFVPPKKKFRGGGGGGGNPSRGNVQGGKKKNAGGKMNGNAVPLGGSLPIMGARPARPANAQSANRQPGLAMRFPGGGGGGGSPRFGMRPQKAAHTGQAPNPLFRPAGSNRGGGPRMSSNNGVRSQAIDFTADIDLM